MAYMMLETSIRTHRKFIAAGPAASWLWACGLGYCQDTLTNGFIPDNAIEFLGVKNARSLAPKLVEVKLWEVVEGGWQMHDYLDHNKSADEVRDIMRRRREGGKKGGRPRKTETSEVSLPPQSDETIEVNLQGFDGSETPRNLPENPIRDGTGRVRDVTGRDETNGRARAAHTSGGAGAGMNPRDHLRHAWCGDFRVCVPDFLHAQFLGRIGGEERTREKRLEEFYARTMAAIPPEQTIGDRPVKFWEAAFEAAFPSAAPTKATTERDRDRAALAAKAAQGPPKRREMFQ